MKKLHFLKSAVLAIAALGMTQAALAAGPVWVSAWKADPSGSTGEIPAGTQTLREIISPRVSGNTVRLRLTNRQGMMPVTFSQVYIGTQKDGATLVPGSNVPLTFNGGSSISLLPGQDAVSDPIAYNVTKFTRLAISMQSFGAQGIPMQSSTHSVSRETNYFSLVPTFNGGGADKESGAGYQPFTLTGGVTFQASWHYINSLDIQTLDPQPRVVVAFGDSITDGLTVNPNTDNTFIEDLTSLGAEQRYPDFLQRRLDGMGRSKMQAVVNAGIAGNRLTAGPFAPFFGPRGLDRLETDVIQVPGVTDVIVHMGVNDIAFDNDAQNTGNRTIAKTLIAGFQETITRLQAKNIRVLLGTIMPGRGAGFGAASPTVNGGAAHGTEITDSLRIEVNSWIRGPGAALSNGVIDFDACTRDPARPSYLNPQFDSGDHLHPNPAGFLAMANCVNLALFPNSSY